MTKDQYLEKHKELVELLGMDMIEKRIQAERDGLTVYQFGYIFALEARIAEMESYLKHIKDVYLTSNHEFGLTMQLMQMCC